MQGAFWGDRSPTSNKTDNTQTEAPHITTLLLIFRSCWVVVRWVEGCCRFLQGLGWIHRKSNWIIWFPSCHCLCKSRCSSIACWMVGLDLHKFCVQLLYAGWLVFHSLMTCLKWEKEFLCFGTSFQLTSSQWNFPVAFQKIRAHLWSEMKHRKFQQTWLNFFCKFCKSVLRNKNV